MLTWHPFPFIFRAISVPAELGCEVGLHERERVADLVSQHLGPNSWVWGSVGREGKVDDGDDEERRTV